MPRTILATALLVFSLLVAATLGRPQPPEAKPVDPNLPPPVQLTAQQDHKKMMELLRIETLRTGANGNNRQAANAANYDESKANPYPKLPDPLILENGQRVTSADAWWHERRPEIVEDFDREIYGRLPKETPKVNWEVTGTTHEKIGEIPVVTKRLVGHVDNSSYPLITVNIQLALTTPADATGPVPLMMEFGFGGFRPGGSGGTKGCHPRQRPKRADLLAQGAAARPGSNSFSPRAGDMPSSSPTASRPTTARA